PAHDDRPRPGGIMAVLEAGRARRLTTWSFSSFRHGADDLLDRFSAYPSRPEDDRRRHGEVDHRRLDAHTRFAAVKDGVDPAIQIGEHMLRPGRARPARTVGAGGSDGDTRGSQEGQ